MSGKRSKRPSCASCAAVRQAQPMTQPVTIKAQTFRMEIMNDPLGGFACGIIGEAGAHFDKADCTSMHARASNTKCVSLALRLGSRAHDLLASARRAQHIVKSCICAKFCEQRIGKQIFVRAIVLPD